MNENQNAQLEAAIDRELKALPHLSAPQTLLPRIMATLERRTVLPWYRRAWQTWPMPLQLSSLFVLLAVFGGLCFGSWELMHAPVVASATTEASGWLRLLNGLLNTLGVLAKALALAVESLGPLVIGGVVLAVLAGYAACLGFGTLYVRLAFARR